MVIKHKIPTWGELCILFPYVRVACFTSSKLTRNDTKAPNGLSNFSLRFIVSKEYKHHLLNLNYCSVLVIKKKYCVLKIFSNFGFWLVFATFCLTLNGGVHYCYWSRLYSEWSKYAKKS